MQVSARDCDGGARTRPSSSSRPDWPSNVKFQRAEQLRWTGDNADNRDGRKGRSDNYAYLVVDDRSRDAVVIDPAHPREVIPVLQRQIDAGKINLTGIINTHHHGDHAGGNNEMVRCYKKHHDRRWRWRERRLTNGPAQRKHFGDLPITGGADCQAVSKTPRDGDEFSVGQGITVTALHTSCHTQDSICYVFCDGDDRAVFTGDTLFIGGCGRFFEGTAAEMHRALNTTLARLPDDTRVYPGHEYTKANVKFAVSVCPDEPVKRLEKVAEDEEETQGKSTIGDEKKHNVFMRVDDKAIQEAVGETDPVEVMAKLRELKNNFR
ncbi:MAG: rRNA-processing protein las1 [Lichina confinis]|nr:MAG: rRNA-processing protein las1 [Lichina confinis]